MKAYRFLMVVAVLTLFVGIGWVSSGLNANEDPIEPLVIGAKAPMVDLKVRSVSGDEFSLQQIAESNGLLVMFSCNTCPYVKAWEDRYPEIYNLSIKNDIGMIALNPNEAYRNKGDGFSDMKKRAGEKKYKFPYALDRHHKLADAFGATRTPEVFLFNKNMKLVYHGAIDDNYESAENVQKPYLKNAIKNLAAGKKIDPSSTKSLGCSIKRGE